MPAGYDGIFHWDWTKGCFGNTNITPMDLDALVERRGHFLVFETKEIGVPIPEGPRRALKALHAEGNKTILIIYGKKTPETAEIWYPSSFKQEKLEGLDSIRNAVIRWWNYADTGKAWTPRMFGKIDEERAAISEYGGRLPRVWAESLAMLQAQSVSAGSEAKELIKIINEVGKYFDLRRPWEEEWEQ